MLTEAAQVRCFVFCYFLSSFLLQELFFNISNCGNNDRTRDDSAWPNVLYINNKLSLLNKFSSTTNFRSIVNLPLFSQPIFTSAHTS